MKVLTVKNPWASFIIHDRKDVENRTWKTNYRGRILIHTSIKRDTSSDAWFYTDWGSVKYVKFLLDVAVDGCIIGSVELVDCVQNSTSRWAEKDRWHWILKNPKPLAVPIPAKGKLGLWEYAPQCTECARINPSSKIDFLPICESDYKAGSCSTFTAANVPLMDKVYMDKFGGLK